MLAPGQTQRGNAGSNIEQFQHRLLTMESTLQHMAKARILNRRTYRKRLQALRALQSEFARLNSYNSATKTGLETETDIGLPRLESCSDEELVVCFEFLKERVSLATAMRQRLTESLVWGAKAAGGASGWFVATLRLSKLRKHVLQVDQWLANLEVEHQNANNQINRLMSDVRLRTGGEIAAANVNGLITLFEDVNKLSVNVTRLRETIRLEEKKAEEMNDWLDSEYKRLRLNREVSPPPKLTLIDKLEKEIDNYEQNPSLRTRDRLVLAKSFLQEQLSEMDDSGLDELLVHNEDELVAKMRSGRRRSRKGGVVAH